MSTRKQAKCPSLAKGWVDPARPILEREFIIVRDTYITYRVSASTLEKIIERDYEVHLPHRHIHNIMLLLGYAKTKNKKDIRKKNWIRYERRHSLTAVHIDWYYDPVKERWVFAVIDDASRYLLALLEVESADYRCLN